MATSGRTRSSFFRTVVQLGSAAAVAFTARASLADHYRVPSGSMEPNVHVGDHIVVSKAAYGLRLPLTETYLLHYAEPARGDVVVIEPEGDLVEVRDGHVRIDGHAANEHTLSLDYGGGPDLGPVRVPKGTVLLLGDNRGNSRDGRTFGFVGREQVLGRAFAVVARDGHVAYEPL